MPEAKRADHVEGTSRPRGDTQPIPVTTTLRNGGASAWVDMAGIDISGNRASQLTACLLRCVVAVCGAEAGRQARDTIAPATSTSSISNIAFGVVGRCTKAPKFEAKIHSSNSFLQSRVDTSFGKDLLTTPKPGSS